jgi:hypothetical protein
MFQSKKEHKHARFRNKTKPRINRHLAVIIANEELYKKPDDTPEA